MARAKQKLNALITGGSSGIGLHLAERFASDGHGVILVAESSKALKSAAQRIQRASPKARIKTITADLAKPQGPKKVFQAVQRSRLPVDILVNNAGVGVFGDFGSKTKLEDELSMMQLNNAAVVSLTKMFLPLMRKRRRGKILFTGSEASVSPIANMSIYSATKAFIYSFGLSLREELKSTGITVTVLLPGATNTNFFARAGMMKTKFVQEEETFADPKDIAQAGYDALMRGDDHVITPFREKVMHSMAKLVPDSWKVQTVE